MTVSTVRRIVYAATILALIALAISLRQQIFSDAGPTAARDTSVSRSATATATHPRVESASTLSSPVSISQVKESAKIHEPYKVSPEASDVSLPESFPSLASQQDNGSGESESGADVDTRDSDALIGRPFPVSGSVKAECKERSARDKRMGCTEMHEILARFARESRDESWAAAIENKVRDYILMKEPGKYTIRALECRTSVCAVESASIYGSLWLDYEFRRGIGLLSEDDKRGYEIDPSGARVTVTVLVYTRREPLP